MPHSNFKFAIRCKANGNSLCVTLVEDRDVDCNCHLKSISKTEHFDGFSMYVTREIYKYSNIILFMLRIDF